MIKEETAAEAEDKNICHRPNKVSVHLRVDGDVLDWFKEKGRGHLTRMNAALRLFMESKEEKGRR